MKPEIIPKVKAKLICIEGYYMYEVRCPYCNSIHRHGAGIEKENVEMFLGIKSTHCNRGKNYETATYELVKK